MTDSRLSLRQRHGHAAKPVQRHIAAIDAAFGALISGTVQMGIFYTGIDTDWFKLFLGLMVLLAVLFNNFIRRRMTEAK